MDLLLSPITREGSYSQRNSCIFRLFPQLRNFSDKKKKKKIFILWCKEPQDVKKWGKSSKPASCSFCGKADRAQGWMMQVRNEPQSLGQRSCPCQSITQEQHSIRRRGGALLDSCPWLLLGFATRLEARHLPWKECLCTLLFHGLLLVLGLHLCHPNSPARHT